MKARKVLHGNSDRDRFSVRRDSSSVHLAVIRLVIYIGTVLGLRFGTEDIKGALIQSGPAKSDILVWPPKEFRSRGNMRKILRPPYGIVEYGRK